MTKQKAKTIKNTCSSANILLGNLLVIELMIVL